MNAGECIRSLRLLRGLNQKGMAHKLGISQQAYSKIERCHYIDREKLHRILSAMNCSNADLDIIRKLLPAPRHTPGTTQN